MIKFLDGDEITAKIFQTIKEADEYLIIISPYIKLTDRIKSEINYLVGKKPNVEIEFVFGKNESDPSKSLNPSDLAFLKGLPNIRISYVKELHAKIYCSEDRLMLSSMNLHGYSQANNYEAAFVIEDAKSMFSGLTNGQANKAWDDGLEFVNKIIGQSMVVFEKGKVYKSSWLGLSTKVIEEYDEDHSGTFFKNKQLKVSDLNSGFCIRTGEPIPFNIKKPFCDIAFKSWVRYKDENFKEKFCHYSGENSNGETSLKTPVLRKNYKLAKVKFGF